MIRVIQSIFCIDLDDGGPARSLPNMCVETQKSGVHNIVVAYESKRPNDAQLKKSSVELCYVKREGNALCRLLSTSYRSVVNAITCDVIHLHSLWTLPLHWAAVYGRRRGIPVVISPRGTLERMDMVKKSLKKQIAWHLYQKNDLKRATCLHATALQEANNLAQLGLDRPIAVIPNGINMEHYPLKSYHRGEGELRTLLFLSRIDPKKGIERLLEAWSGVDAPLRSGWRLVIAGTGRASYVDRIERLISAQYPNIGIEYVGAKYDKQKIEQYHNADIFILPSYSENFGMVVAEAMACGLPAITTTTTPWQCLQERQAGWWIENSVQNIGQAMAQAISLTDATREQMGRRAREIIQDSYSIDSVAKAYVELYEWMVGASVKTPNFIINQKDV